MSANLAFTFGDYWRYAGFAHKYFSIIYRALSLPAEMDLIVDAAV